jgi:hypothetical protein
MSIKYKKHSSNPFIDDDLLIYRDDEKRVTTKKWYRKKVKSKREINNPKGIGRSRKSGRWKGTFYKKNKITKQTKHRIGVIR